VTGPHSLILVVDDDRDLRECLDIMLTALGFSVVGAGNGQEALEVLDRCRPDLILLDMKMPVMDGWEFCRVLDRRGSHPPIVVVTAAHDPAERAADVHAQGWLAKPFDCDQMEMMVNQFVPRSD
jgi:urea transport system substrate-binding protein